MADQLTDRTELAETPATDDLLWVRDTSDTTDSASGTDKKVTRQNLLGNWDLNINIVAPNATVPVLVASAVNVSEANADVALTPKGTGALMAQVPDGATAGGNKRGNYSVDLQLERLTATAVASGAHSVIGGGLSNTASAVKSTVAGGEYNEATGQGSAVGGGERNEAAGNNSVVAGGERNNSFGANCAILGGYGNSIAANCALSSIVGGGGGGNGNSISQSDEALIASGHSNSIGASTASNYSAIVSGNNNTINGGGAFLGAGVANSVSAGEGVLVGGAFNEVSGARGFVGAGRYNTAAGAVSAVVGGERGKAVITGQQAHAMGRFSNDGDAQRSHVIAKVATSDDTATEIEVDDETGAIAIPDNTTWEAQIRIVARQEGGAEQACFQRRALITKDGTAASTILVGSSTPDPDLTSAGASTWSVSVSADTTNGALKIDVTGEAATNIRWVAHISLVEVGYA